MTTIEPTSVKPHPIGSGTQRLYRFDNGYGASVVQFFLGMAGSYGASSGLWELAVLRLTGEGEMDWELTYATPVTDDVIGHLSEDEVQEKLRQIRDLPRAEVEKLRADLPVPVIAHTRRTGLFRWMWWTTSGRYGGMADTPQRAYTKRGATRLAKRAAERRAES